MPSNIQFNPEEIFNSLLSSGVLIILGWFGWWLKKVAIKASTAVSADEVSKMIDKELQSKTELLELKIDNLEKMINKQTENISEKLDTFANLILKDAHLELKNTKND